MSALRIHHRRNGHACGRGCDGHEISLDDRFLASELGSLEIKDTGEKSPKKKKAGGRPKRSKTA